jgi:hypothetical protein
MLIPVRSAVLVMAALTASSVAPAQVAQQGEPLIAASSATVPVSISATPLPIEEPALLPAD